MTAVLSPINKFSQFPKMTTSQLKNFEAQTEATFSGSIQVVHTRQSHQSSTQKSNSGQIEFFSTNKGNRRAVIIRSETNDSVTSYLDLSRGTYDVETNTYVFNSKEGFYIFILNGDELKLEANLVQNGTRYEFKGTLQRN